MKPLRDNSMLIIFCEDTIIEHYALNKTVTDKVKALVSNNFRISALNIALV